MTRQQADIVFVASDAYDIQAWKEEFNELLHKEEQDELDRQDGVRYLKGEEI